MSNTEKPEKVSKFDALLNMVGLEAEYEEIPEKAEKPKKSDRSERQVLRNNPSSTSYSTSASAASAPSDGKSQIILIEPEKRSEAQKIVDFLKQGKTVVINVEKMEKEDVVRLWDFITGASYALEGKTEILNEKVLITAPKTVDIKPMESAKPETEEEEEEEFEF